MQLTIGDFKITADQTNYRLTLFGNVEELDPTIRKPTGNVAYKAKETWYPASLKQALIMVFQKSLIQSDAKDAYAFYKAIKDSETKIINALEQIDEG